MKTDLFISYAWTTNAHQEWVRLLASQLHLIGYIVKIDEAVDLQWHSEFGHLIRGDRLTSETKQVN